MGGNTSHGPVSGHLFIETFTRNYSAGDPIFGTIHLFLTQAIPARTLFLKFKGTESVILNRNPGSSFEEFKHQIVNPQYVFGGVIVSQRFPIFEFTVETTGPGQFSFPFSFVLPSDIPGSFRLADAVCISSVKYAISASLKGEFPKVEKHEVPLSITELRSDPVRNPSDYEDCAVSSGCCSRKGLLRLNITLQQSEFNVGELIKILIDVDNSQSSVAIIGFEAALYRIMRVETRNRRVESFYRNLRTSRVERVVPPGGALLGQANVRIGVTLDDDEHDIQEAVSVRSRIVQCEYSVNVIALLSSRMCGWAENPVFVRTVKVLPTQLPVLAPANVPVSWRPEVLPLVRFDIADEYSYEPSPDHSGT